MKLVFGFGPEAVICHIPIQLAERARRDELTIRPALSFFPDLKTSSPEPEGGNSSTNSPNTKSIFRAAMLALIWSLYLSGYASFNRFSWACTIVIFFS